MATKDLYVYVNGVGQKIKTSNLTFNQNSTNSLLHFITVGYFKAITATFRTADGELSANYNVPLTGKYTITSDDTEPVLVENADNLYEYDLYIPYKVSSTFIVASSSRISVAFHCFNYDNTTKVLVNTMTANTQLVLNRADVSGSIDESYNLTDVENLWKTVNDLNYYNDSQDTLISANSTAISYEATRAKAAEAALDTAKADKATTLAGYGITDAYTKAETTNELAKCLPLAGGTLTGLLYTSSSTPFFIGLDGKVGMRASDSTNKNYGQMNISNAWYDSTHWGAQMSAYNGATDKYNSIRISHNGPQYIDENDIAHLLGNADDITTETTRATTAEATLQAAINTKLDLKPDGTNYLLVSNKLNPLYIPDSILGQVIYGGTIASTGVCTLSDMFKSKYPTVGSVTITYNSANAYTGVYFIASDNVSIAAGTYDAIKLLTGDWLLSNGSTGYVKVDNTDAVTGVKGDSESTYRIGNINLTSDNIGTYDKATITSKIATETTRATTAETTNATNITQEIADRKAGDTSAITTAENFTSAGYIPKVTTAIKGNIPAFNTDGTLYDSAYNATALDKRIANLESANEGKTLTTNTDTTAAYVKTNPDNCLDYGIVSKIYGRDRVCTNIKTQTSAYRLYIFTWKYGINTFEFSGTVSQNYWPASKLSTENLVVGKTYTLKATSNQSIYAPTICIILNGTSTNYDEPCTFTFAEGMTIYVYYNLLTSTEITIDIITYIQLSGGSNALPYEPYFSGFYNNTPSKVIVRGTNLMNIPDIAETTENGFKYSIIKNHVSLENTVENNTSIFFKKIKTPCNLKAGSYYLSKQNKTNTSSIYAYPYIRIYLYDCYDILIGDMYFWDSDNASIALSRPCRYIIFSLVLNNSTADSSKFTISFDVMLNAGSAASTFTAYTESTIDISSLGKTLHGIDLSDSTKCDELDLVNKTYTNRFNTITLTGSSAEGWTYQSSLTRFVSNALYTPSNGAYSNNGIISDSNYLYYSGPIGTDRSSNGIAIGSDGKCYLTNSNFTTVEELTSYLSSNNIRICYSVVPITESLSIADDFKFFPSISLGSVTFDSDKQDDVLSEVVTEVKVA